MLFFCVLRFRQLLLLEEQRCTATGSCSHGKNIDLKKIKKKRKSLGVNFKGFVVVAVSGEGGGGV